MPKTSFLIIENSYVISSGLAKIINLLPGALARELNDIQLINKELEIHPAEIVIINTRLLNQPEIKIGNKTELLKEVHIVYLAESRKTHPENKEDCSHFLYLEDSENEIKKQLLHIIEKTRKKTDNKEDSDELSQRETEVLKLVAQGKTNKEIAHELFISIHTVITHRKHITKKLGIKTVAGITVYAILNNLIDMNKALN